MNIWQILSTLWKYKSEIYQIITWLYQGITWLEISAKVAQFNKDEQNAEATKNTSSLEGEFNGTNKPTP